MNSRWSFALALCLGVLVFSHADADHHKKKNKDNGAELTQCTIVKSGGMGCVAPLKLKCEKMKNGQKCCACVGDKNAKAAQPDKTTTPSDEDAKLDALIACSNACDQDCAAKMPAAQEAELGACRISCKSKCPQ